MILFVGFLGIAVNGTPDWYGYAHVVLQPLLYIGICTVAAGVGRLPIGWRYALLAGLAVDFWLGIFLHLDLEHWTGQDVLTLGPGAISNMDMQLQGHITFLGDRVGAFGGILLPLLAAVWLAGMLWIGRALLRPRRPGVAVS